MRVDNVQFAVGPVLSLRRMLHIVMRIFKIAVWVMGLSAGSIALWLMFAWRHQPNAVPIASITLLGYRSFAMTDRGPNVYVYPGPGHWIQAQMNLKNEGRESISFGAWGDEPYGWANAETTQGLTNGYMAPRFTGGTFVLAPGSNANFWVVLPTDTTRWQCGFSVETASVRERATWQVLRHPFCAKLVFSTKLFFWPLRLFPDKSGPTIEVKSESLKVDPNSISPPRVGGRHD